MLAPNRIRFGGVFSDELNMPDLIIDCAFDSDNSEVSTFLTREAVASETYDGRNRRIAAFKYTENFSPKLTFLKKDFEDFTQDEVRALLKYLTFQDTTALLETYDDDSNVVSWASIGNFSEIQLYKIANKRTIGITAVWDSISPFAYSDLYNYTQNAAVQINTTMHYWISETISGQGIPQYVLTNVQTPKVGTEMYTASRALTNSVIDTPLTFFGSISSVNADGSYVVNETTFKLTHVSEKIKRTYSNRITIDIDTDDNKPIYPRITINHGYSGTPHTVVPILPHITFSGLVDMQNYVENTVYYNDVNNTYYWKTSEPIWCEAAEKPNYDGWTIIEVTRPYTEEDVYEGHTFYHYVDGNMYYWVDPYNFHSSNENPGLPTTSVKITNQHYDFFGVPSAPTTTIVKNNTGTEKIVLDGTNKIIYSDRTRRVFGNDFNLQHLELYDGKNEITIDGNCEVTIEYRTAIKIGEY